MNGTRERISVTFDPRNVVISPHWLQLCLRSVVCAILERISGFRACIWNNCSKVLEACFCSKHLSFNIDLPLDAIGDVCFLVWSFHHLSSLYTLCWFCQLEMLVPAFLQEEHQLHRQCAYSSVTYAYFSIMFFQSIRHNHFEEKIEGGQEETSLPHTNCCSEPYFRASIHLKPWRRGAQKRKLG